MEKINVTCPICNKNTQLEPLCHNCGSDLRQLTILYNMAAQHYNDALKLIKQQSWDEAWNKALNAVRLFPQSQLFCLLAIRLARELGYFSYAMNLLKTQKQVFEPEQYDNIKQGIEQDTILFNNLLEDKHHFFEEQQLLMVHRRLIELQRPKKWKPDIAFWKTSMFVLLLIVISTSFYQYFRYNSLSQVMESFKSQSIQADNKIASLQSLIKEERENRENFQLLLIDLPASSREQVLSGMYEKKKYEELAALDIDSWFTKSATFMVIWENYKHGNDVSDNLQETIQKMESWLEANEDFPSHYGDACLALISYYEDSQTTDENKQRYYAQKLRTWLQKMPQTKEYLQYDNLKIKRILDESDL